MSFLKYQQQILLKCLAGLSIAVLFVILFFGLRPKGFNFSNNVNWIIDQPGIRFGKHGIAYTKYLFTLVEDDDFNLNEFSIQIAFKSASNHERGFKFILALHGRKDSDQLLIGQWRSWIICMNGDDYAHKRGTKRISFNIASMSSEKGLLTVTTGKEGVRVYFDGQLVREKKDLNLKIPNGGNARLLLGNSVYGKHSWIGDIYGLAFYRYTLPAQDVALHYNAWFKSHDFSFAKKDKVFGLYLFDERENSKVFDNSGRKQHLEIPSKMRILQREILTPPWKGFELNRNLIQDIIVNLVGFIPFGFFLYATQTRLDGSFKKHPVLITVSVCFMVSMIIEIFQAWMPTRSSQMLDIILNSLGGLIGVMICASFGSHFHKEDQPFTYK